MDVQEILRNCEMDSCNLKHGLAMDCREQCKGTLGSIKGDEIFKDMCDCSPLQQLQVPCSQLLYPTNNVRPLISQLFSRGSKKTTYKDIRCASKKGFVRICSFRS